MIKPILEYSKYKDNNENIINEALPAEIKDQIAKSILMFIILFFVMKITKFNKRVKLAHKLIRKYLTEDEESEIRRILSNDVKYSEIIQQLSRESKQRKLLKKMMLKGRKPKGLEWSEVEDLNILPTKEIIKRAEKREKEILPKDLYEKLRIIKIKAGLNHLI